MIGLTRPEDEWVAYDYDMAAGLLGMWCSGKLAETDKQGRPRHSLDGLLNDRKPNQAARRYRTDFDRIPFEAA